MRCTVLWGKWQLGIEWRWLLLAGRDPARVSLQALGWAMPMVKKGILRPEWSLKVELQA